MFEDFYLPTKKPTAWADRPGMGFVLPTREKHPSRERGNEEWKMEVTNAEQLEGKRELELREGVR